MCYEIKCCDRFFPPLFFSSFIRSLLCPSFFFFVSSPLSSSRVFSFTSSLFLVVTPTHIHSLAHCFSSGGDASSLSLFSRFPSLDTRRFIFEKRVRLFFSFRPDRSCCNTRLSRPHTHTRRHKQTGTHTHTRSLTHAERQAGIHEVAHHPLHRAPLSSCFSLTVVSVSLHAPHPTFLSDTNGQA